MVALQIAVGEYRWPGLTPEAGWRVADVGANIGVFSLWAERLGAEVTAYEPESRTFASLVTNVAGRRISPRQAALVSKAAPTARLYLSELDSTRHTMVGKEM
jgi:FkbM family methyltransferase